MNAGLTAFRFFAFFAVFIFHCYPRSFPAGYLGVSAFFVLSGFLITAILVKTKDTLARGEFFVTFYGRRSLRIFPLYYAYLLVMSLIVWACVQNEVFFRSLPWALTYTYNFFMASSAWRDSELISHFWSLAVEEQFYLLWPAVIWLLPRRHIKTFLVLVMIAGPLVRGLCGYVVDNKVLGFVGHHADRTVYVLSFSHFDAFAAGGLFALYKKGISARRVLVLTVVVIAVGLVTARIATGHYYWRGLGYSPFMRDSLKYVWGYSLLNILFAYLLVSIRDRRLFPKVMEARILVYLGTISYGLYVFHPSVVYWLSGGQREGLGAGGFCVALALTVGISAASYRWMEKPVIQLKERYFPKE